MKQRNWFFFQRLNASELSLSLSRWGFMGLGRFCQTLHVVSKVVSGYGKVYNLEVDESR